FRRPQAAAAAEPPPPEHGLLLTTVVPGGNADKGGVRAGDVLLRYGERKLTALEDLKPADGGDPVPVEVWRDGQTLELKLPPGRLGVVAAREPAPVALRLKREGDALVRGARGPEYRPLPGTRREVEAIARLFPAAETLLGSAASEQRL